MGDATGRPSWRFVARLGLTLAAATIAIFLTTRFVARPWRISGPSMEPTLHDGDRVIVDVWTLRRRGPHVGEIVLFQPPGREDRVVKRVSQGPKPGPVFGTYTYVVLGDNPLQSWDSREFGPIASDRIFGRVVFRYWPLSGVGTME